jgi:hypothetical protein
MVVEPPNTDPTTSLPATVSTGAAGQAHADGLKARDPLFLLAHRIFRSELEALRMNLRPQKALPLPQEIHQARIALRRLRGCSRTGRSGPRRS